MADEKNEKKKGFFSRFFRGGRSETPASEEVIDEPVGQTPIEDDPIASAPEEKAEAAGTLVVEEEAAQDVAEIVEPEAPPEEMVSVTEQAVLTPEEPAEGKRGFFRRLKDRLGKTKTGLVDRVRQVISFHGKIDEELLEEIEMVLIQADVGVETTTKILEEVRKNREARRIEDPQQLVPLIKESILKIVGHSERALKLQPKPPTVILVVGVNGTGKTTTIGKLAKQYHDTGKKVMMVAADTFRAAAVEQLNIWAERTRSLIVERPSGTDPSAVCFDALSSSNARFCDVILIDTAGRLHTKSNLMEELRKIDRVIKKVMPDAPHETLLVLDATTGQNALSQAKLFSETVQLTGFIMTKLDGTAKGGILIALRDLFDIPVLKIGIGEGVEDLRDFDPQAYADALFEESEQQ